MSNNMMCIRKPWPKVVQVVKKNKKRETRNTLERHKGTWQATLAGIPQRTD